MICPECKGGLEFFDAERENIDGVLRCAGAHVYPVIRGVPVLICNDHLEEFLSDGERASLKNLCEKRGMKFNFRSKRDLGAEVLRKSSGNWSFQWNTYDNEKTVWEDEETFKEHIPLDFGKTRGDATVLEIGCGRGRNIKRVKNKNNLVFAIDISESAYLAHKRYEQTENVFVIRADAARLPFGDDFFEVVLSDHTLQHIYDLGACFDEVCRVSKKDSRFIFNLYSRENNALMIRFIEPLKRAMLDKLPIQCVHFFAHFPAVLLWLSLRLVYFPLYRRAPKLYKALPLFQHMVFWFAFSYGLLRQTCFDLLQAPKAYYFSGEEIQKLCDEKQFRLERKYLLRQTLWVCVGSFCKG